MKKIEFEKLIEEEKPQRIISMHTHNKIYLTNKQLDKVIELKGEEPMKKTQADRVLDYIKQFGSITSLEAFRDLGVTRLSARIFELRARNIEIDSTTITSKNRFGENCSYAKYYLK
jgi:hypothetical protein